MEVVLLSTPPLTTRRRSRGTPAAPERFVEGDEGDHDVRLARDPVVLPRVRPALGFENDEKRNFSSWPGNWNPLCSPTYEARPWRPASASSRGSSLNDHSDRNAWMTSTRDARAAGTSDARIAAATRIVTALTMGSAPGMRMSGM